MYDQKMGEQSKTSWCFTMISAYLKYDKAMLAKVKIVQGYIIFKRKYVCLKWLILANGQQEWSFFLFSAMVLLPNPTHSILLIARTRHVSTSSAPFAEPRSLALRLGQIALSSTPLRTEALAVAVAETKTESQRCWPCDMGFEITFILFSEQTSRPQVGYLVFGILFILLPLRWFALICLHSAPCEFFSSVPRLCSPACLCVYVFAYFLRLK